MRDTNGSRHRITDATVRLLSTTLLVSSIACASVAHARGTDSAEAPVAQSAPDSHQLDDIIVTANRQSLGSQSVPISLTAVGAEQLAEQGITSTDQMSQLAPSLFVNSGVSDGSMRFSMRGISNNDTLPAASSAVATYIDDVYQAVLFGTATALFDVQRIEVLRGPQGTTFGRNTTGGAVAYFSQLPTNELEGYVKARISSGNRPERFIEGVLNVPIVDDKFAMRISTRFDTRNAYIEDVTQGYERGWNDTQSGRLQLRFTPSEATAINLTIHGSRQRADAPLGRGIVTPVNVFDFIGFAAQDFGRDRLGWTPGYRYFDNFDNWGATLRIEHDFGGFNLTSITHYRNTDFSNAQDVDGSANDLMHYQSYSKSSQYGQELRLASDPDKPLSGILGIYYEKDKLNELTTESATRAVVGGVVQPGAMTFFGAPVEYNNRARYITETEAYAAFLNVTFKPIDSIAIIGGIRKSHETRRQNAHKDYFQPLTLIGGPAFDWTPENLLTANPGPTDVLDYVSQIKVQPWTWDATINYNPYQGLLVFARVAKGYRSGGFNPAVTQFFPRIPDDFFGPGVPGDPALVAPPSYGAEQVQSYEIGIKTTLFDGVRLNASVFHYDYTDQQVTSYVGGVVVTANAGASKIDGAEVELSASPFEGFDLRGSVSYTDARYDKFDDPRTPVPNDYGGNQLIQAPKWTGTASATYTTPVSDKYQVQFNTNWSFRSEVFATADNLDAYRSAPTAIGNLRVSLDPVDGKGFGLAAFINNVTDRRPYVSGFTFGTGFDIAFYGTGRLFGLDASFNF